MSRKTGGMLSDAARSSPDTDADAEQILLIRGRVSFVHPSDGKPRKPAAAPSMAILWRHPPDAAGSPRVRGLSWR